MDIKNIISKIIKKNKNLLFYLFIFITILVILLIIFIIFLKIIQIDNSIIGTKNNNDLFRILDSAVNVSDMAAIEANKQFCLCESINTALEVSQKAAMESELLFNKVKHITNNCGQLSPTPLKDCINLLLCAIILIKLGF